jgi:uroporphyrinogen decarboxylase
MFPSDPREEIMPDLEPRPKPDAWPETQSDLDELAKRLDPSEPERLPADWPEHVRNLAGEDTVRMLRVHRGLFLSTGVYGWNRFTHVMVALKKDPDFIHETMGMWSRFSAAMAERVLKEIDIDAAIFSEPIGGNEGPLISPRMYEEFVLSSYRPVLDLLHRYHVETIIFRTYANARLLIPSILKFGFNCLWACEVNIGAMDYRDIRREFGRDLRLIGGIDLDALREGREAVRRELEEKVPPLLADGGYVPLADGRVRKDVPFEDYKYYRELLSKLIRIN